MEQINNHIAILMATYNGERYLSEQILSILTQTCQDWHLYIHDDGSTDHTVDMIKEFVSNYPNKITLLDYPSQGGACYNFMSMLEHIDAPYYMFCDQDDVWLSEKIETEYLKIQEIEKKQPKTPIIINTDLTVVDKNLKCINPSFWEFSGINTLFLKDYDDYAANNAVTGCTMLFNKAAKRAIKHPYKEALMHDSWITLSVAAAKGIVYYIPQQLVLYRQHGHNTLGVRNIKELTWKYRLMNIVFILRKNQAHYRQMNAVYPISLVNYIITKIRYKFSSQTIRKKSQ